MKIFVYWTALWVGICLLADCIYPHPAAFSPEWMREYFLVIAAATFGYWSRT